MEKERLSCEANTFVVYLLWEKEEKSMDLRLLEIHSEGKAYRDELFALYEDTFPRVERKPVSSLEKTCAEGKMKILAVCEGEEFVGLAVLMTDGSLLLLDYLAILPEKRNLGYGGAVLHRLLEEYNACPLAVEIERIDPSAEDNRERMSRRAFYLRNGMKSSGVFVWLFHMEYELLCANGEVSYESYRSLLTHCMGNRMKPFLRKID